MKRYASTAARNSAGVMVQKKFTEPVALLSTSPMNLRLPPTALGSGFDLLALRARCKREDRGSGTRVQVASGRFGAICGEFRLRRANWCPVPCAPLRTTQKFTEPVALSSTSPVNLWLPPRALGSGFDLLALRARCKNESTGSDVSPQAPSTRICRILRARDCPHFHGFCRGLGRTLWISGKAGSRCGERARRCAGGARLRLDLTSIGVHSATTPGSGRERADPAGRHVARRGLDGGRCG